MRDRRGALGDAVLRMDGQAPVNFQPWSMPALELANAGAPGTVPKHSSSGLFASDPSVSSVLSAPVGSLDEVKAMDVQVSLPLGGARSFAIMPFARTTRIDLAANWPNPGFAGDYLPAKKHVDKNGFTASRTIPALASALPPLAYDSDFSRWTQSHGGMAVKLVAGSSPYQYVSRALKYALMFTGFVFLTFFLFETTDARPVHAAQYVLIGIAQTVFYLLLLAFAERIGFDAAFAIAALATVGLLGAYAGTVFGRRRIAPALAIFGTLYGLMFVLMRLQDFALMVGALASFAAIATTMWMTRNIDWYGTAQKP